MPRAVFMLAAAAAFAARLACGSKGESDLQIPAITAIFSPRAHASVESFPAKTPLYGGLDLKVNHLTTADGLPQNKIFDIAETPDGMLWLATGMGLVQYDGAQFTLYDRGNSSLKAEFCTALALDEQDRLWVATYNGYAILDHNGFTHFPPLSAKDSEHKILRMIPSRQGGVWMKTDSSIWRVTKDECERIASLEDLDEKRVLTLRENPQGDLFLRCDGGRIRIRYDKREAEKLQWEDEDINPPHYLGFDDYGWLGPDYADTPLLKLATGCSRAVSDRPEVRRTPWVTSFKKTDGLWLALANTGDYYLYQRIPGDGWNFLERISNIIPEAIYEDRRGHIWIGTQADGLIQIIPQKISTITRQDGLDQAMVRSVYPASGGGVWAALHAKKMHRIRKQEVTQYRTPYKGSAKDFRVVYEDSRGRIWFGGRLGFNVLQNGRIDRCRLNGISSLPKAIREWEFRTWTMLEDSHGHLWIGTEKGLLRFNRGKLKSVDDHLVIPESVIYYDEVPDLAGKSVRAIYEDSKRRIWVGTAEHGIYRIGGNGTRHYTKDDGLSDNHINGFYEDQEGVLWISTVIGLSRFHKGRWTVYTEAEGLYEDRIHTLLPDDSGNFWMSSNRGIFRVKRSALNAVASGQKSEVESVVYSEIDGMATAEANGDYQHVGCRGENGYFFFPTVKGVVAFKPEQLIANENRPEVVLESISVDKETVCQYVGRGTTNTGVRTRLRLGPGPEGPLDADPQNRTGAEVSADHPPARQQQPALDIPAGKGDLVHVEFTIPSPVNPTQWRFRYRLVGYNSDWVDAKLQRQVYYANLPPGRYEFQVQAQNAHGLWNANDAGFSFLIRPHFYQTTTFQLLSGGMGLLLLWGGHRFHLRRRQRWIELENELKLEREKSRISQDIHDEVGGHVTRLRFASELAKQNGGNPNKLREHLDRITGIAAEVSNSFSEVIWLTNPKHDTLDNLLSYLRRYITEFAEATSLEPRIDFPESIPATPISPDFRRKIFLTSKESLNNIAKHSRASRVDVSVNLTGDYLTMKITDNGQGVPSTERWHGHGMKNMSSRIQSINGSFSISTGPEQGTRIDIAVPLN